MLFVLNKFLFEQLVLLTFINERIYHPFNKKVMSSDFTKSVKIFKIR